MWALVTRSRPASCERFIQSWVNSQANTPVYVRLDSCDPDLDKILALPWPQQFNLVVGNRVGYSLSINEMFEKYPKEPWYGMLADDLVPQSLQWDKTLIDACGSWNISYANDLGARDWPTHPCVGGELVRAVGWFGIPDCEHYFTDTVWKYIGDSLNIMHRLDHVVVEHMHYSLGKSDHDQTYKYSNSKWKTDKQAYGAWCQEQGPVLLTKLRTVTHLA